MIITHKVGDVMRAKKKRDIHAPFPQHDNIRTLIISSFRHY